MAGILIFIVIFVFILVLAVFRRDIKIIDLGLGDKVFFIFPLIVGLIPLIFGIIIAAQTIRLYVNGVETSATIEKIYVTKPTARRPHTGGSTFKSKRYAVVRYKTESGMTEASVQIKFSTQFMIGETVQVIYLPTLPPRAAIRGHADIEKILLSPLIPILVGSLFFSFGIGQLAKQSNKAVVQKRLSTVANIAIWTNIMAILIGSFIIVPAYVLYKFVPATYNRFYKFMAQEETLREPLLGPGVTAIKLPEVGFADACKQPSQPHSLSHTVASSGDRIELHGTWAMLTSNRVPVINGHNRSRRLKVLEWTPEIMHVEIPRRLKKGKHKVDVNCYWDSSSSYVPTTYLEIQID